VKTAFFAAAAIAAAAAFAAEAPKQADPNPFASYDTAMKSTTENPFAVEWSRQNDAKIAAATSEAALAAFVSDASAADALLARIGAAYSTDPLVMTQIAAVTQYVMRPEPWWSFATFWEPSASSQRATWVAALRRRAAMPGDAYVKTFCEQQLYLCR